MSPRRKKCPASSQKHSDNSVAGATEGNMARHTQTNAPQTTERLQLRSLRPHRQQEVWFTALSEPELEALAASMQHDGLQHPVHVLPDGTILAGHQRVAAARRL